MNADQLKANGWTETAPGQWTRITTTPAHAKPPTTHPDTLEGIKTPKQPKARLNKRETLCKAILVSRGITEIMEQAITLRLDPPFKSYTPDLAYWDRGVWQGHGRLILVEVKGPHRFRRAGIAKAALAAKTYPQFHFELFDWDGKQWKESVLSP